MAKKKNRGGPPIDTEAPSVIKPAGPIGTSLKDLLKGVEVAPPPDPKKAKAKTPHAASSCTAARPRAVARSHERAATSETLRGEDRTAFLDALAGVRPMRGRAAVRIGAVAKPPAPREREREAASADAEARARLTALVAGGVRFDVHREDGWTQGLRRDTKPGVLQTLRRAEVGSEATLDLHGLRAVEAADRVSRFVREAHRSGLRRVLIIHGRGAHSEHGVGVLGDVVVKALSEGGAAPFTVAFVTAPVAQGGPGAILVELTRR